MTARAFRRYPRPIGNGAIYMPEKSDLFAVPEQKPAETPKPSENVDKPRTARPKPKQPATEVQVHPVVPLLVSKVRDRKRAAKFATVRGGAAAAALFREQAAAELSKPVSLAMAEAISTTTGLPLADVLRCRDGAEIVAKVLAWRAMLGHVPSFQEIQDRLDPKVAKVDATVTARPMAPHGDDATENEAAAAYFEEID